MARERFDDVGYRIVEAPERLRPRVPRRVRRRALGGATAMIVIGGLAAGASALSRHPHAAVRSWRNGPHMHYGAAGLPPAGLSTLSSRTVRPDARPQ